MSDLLVQAVFDAFVGTLRPAGVWYEYSWQECVPRTVLKRTWWGAKRLVELTPEVVTRTSMRSLLGWERADLSLVFDKPTPFTVAVGGPEAQDLSLRFYVKASDETPFLHHGCAKVVRPGEVFRLADKPSIGFAMGREGSGS